MDQYNFIFNNENIELLSKFLGDGIIIWKGKIKSSFYSEKCSKILQLGKKEFFTKGIWLEVKQFISSNYKNVDSFIAEIGNKHGMRKCTYFRKSKKHIVLIFSYVDSHLVLEKKVRKEKKYARKRNTLVNTFLASMSHEIRTPLNGIMGFVQILMNDHTLSQTQRSHVNFIFDSSKTLCRLIDDILDYTKMKADGLSFINDNFNIVDVIEFVINQQKMNVQKKQIVIKTNISDDVFDVNGDKERFQQVLTNIYTNAIKYTNDGSITISLSRKNNKIVTVIEDTGIGISKKNIKRLFVPFSRIDANDQTPGTGLGLCICKRIVTGMGGTIDLKSVKGLGTTVTISVIFDDPLPKVDVIGKLGNTERKPHKIAIVEDNKINVLAVKGMLYILGFENVDIYNDGFKIARNWKKYDLILMDIGIPGRDGLETAKIMKSNGCEVPIIAVTANAITSDVNMYKSTMDGYIQKPINMSHLSRILESYLC